MTCGSCALEFESAGTVKGLTICPRCLATVQADTGERATAVHTLALTDVELKSLRDLRKRQRAAIVAAP